MKIRILLTMIASFALTGCFTYNAYIDPSYPQASLEELKKVENPHKYRITSQFLVNNVIQLDVQDDVDRFVNAVFVKSGVIFPYVEADEEIALKINNTGNEKGAAAKGLLTGFTFGAVGASVTDNYDIDIILYSSSGEKLHTKKYKQAMHSTIGNKSAPIPDVEPFKDGNKAFNKILENVIFNFIKDMQAMSEVNRTVRIINS